MAEYKAGLIKYNGIVAGDHGVRELWANSDPSSAFAGQSFDIASDIQYDALVVVAGPVSGEQILPTWFEIDKFRTGNSIIEFCEYDKINDASYVRFVYRTRLVSVVYDSTTHKYTITFSDGSQTLKLANSNAATTASTTNTACMPYRILGVMHNE